ncbi:hypothetical protein GCM10025859_11030 [Alicyclobacillus fastidiosus]|nr:hypothetical protein GCM10025859_11030 [Alicyclobacillus fastidiosus]
MEIFSYLGKYDYEQLVFCSDEASGLKAIIAIHDTTLGPALGGCRMWTYVREDDAILDALRLARGMTYKAAVSGLNLGGGKTVIMGNPKTDKSEALFRSLGRYIQGLSGRYITAEDVGTNVHDMDLIHTETDYVTGISQAYGSSGNPRQSLRLACFAGCRPRLRRHLARMTWRASASPFKVSAVSVCNLPDTSRKLVASSSWPTSTTIPFA